MLASESLRICAGFHRAALSGLESNVISQNDASRITRRNDADTTVKTSRETPLERCPHPFRHRIGPRHAAAGRARHRCRQLSRRALCGHDPGRVRRRGHQGRASRRRRPDAPLRHRHRAAGRDAEVAQREPQQEVRHLRSAPARRRGTVLEAGRQVRCAGRELPPRHDGKLGPGLGGAARGEPEARDAARHRLRPDRAVPPPPRLRPHRAGLRWPELPGRLPRRDAGAAGHGAAGRLHRQPVRHHRRDDRAAPCRRHRARAGHRCRHL